MREEDYQEQAMDEIRALMKECLATLDVEQMTSDTPQGRLKVRQIIHKVAEQLAQKIGPLNLVTKQEYGQELVIEGLICMAAALYEQRRKQAQQAAHN